MRRFALPLLVSAAVLLALIAGPRAWAKLALLAGQPALAVHLLKEPAPLGVALYRAGDYAAADAAFAAAGNNATYDRGNSLAATGTYELAVAYYDAVLFADPDDEDARHNRDIVWRLLLPLAPSANPTPGRKEDVRDNRDVVSRLLSPLAPAAKRIATKPLTIAQKVALRNQQHVHKPLTAQALEANRRWLANLPDAPGRYLKALLAADYARRFAEGKAIAEKGAW